MKKNKMMRLASAVLVCTLLTTSVISGTFAKYTSTSSASDNARVAKWGVTLAANGLLYSELYNVNGTADNANQGTIDTQANVTVATYNNATAVQSIVAPGTKNITGMTFTVNGRPEVAVALTGTLNASTTVLPAATYVVANVNAAYEGGAEKANVNVKTSSSTLTAPYYPVKYTLKKDTSTTIAENVNLIAICEKLDAFYTAHTEEGADNENTSTTPTVMYAYSDNAATTSDYGANSDLGALIQSTTANGGVYTLTWAWDFEANPNMDVYDTFLGDIAYAAVGEDGYAAVTTNICCYKVVDAGTTTFYSVEAAELEGIIGATSTTAVTYADLAANGIGIEESFAMTITATQID